MQVHDPGHPDLIAAEFKAKAAAGVLLGEPELADERGRRGAALAARWAILAVVSVLAVLTFNDPFVTGAVIGLALLGAVAEIWLWRHRDARGWRSPTGAPD